MAHMNKRRLRTTSWALAVVIVGAAVLTLSPLPIYTRAVPAIARVLDVLHSGGAPGRLDLHVLEAGANVLLFVPLGFLVALLLPRRRWWLVLLGAALASTAVETVQSVLLPHRIGSPRDVLDNTLGAAVGIGLAAAWQTVQRRRRGRTNRPPGAPDDATPVRPADPNVPEET